MFVCAESLEVTCEKNRFRHSSLCSWTIRALFIFFFSLSISVIFLNEFFFCFSLVFPDPSVIWWWWCVFASCVLQGDCMKVVFLSFPMSSSSSFLRNRSKCASLDFHMTADSNISLTARREEASKWNRGVGHWCKILLHICHKYVEICSSFFKA